MASTRTAVGAFLIATLFAGVLSASPAQSKVTDLTPQFKTAGVSIDRLSVYEVGGIVIIRGRTPEKAEAAEAARVATDLGYTRVANLVQIVEPIDDPALQRAAERELTMNRSLDGCSFRIKATEGVVSIAGRVRHELQKDVAVELVKNIDGVKAVQSTLER
jgi:osmotically-inducible protein OsmY